VSLRPRYAVGEGGARQLYRRGERIDSLVEARENVRMQIDQG
jgi:hypothetical protein